MEVKPCSTIDEYVAAVVERIKAVGTTGTPVRFIVWDIDYTLLASLFAPGVLFNYAILKQPQFIEVASRIYTLCLPAARGGCPLDSRASVKSADAHVFSYDGIYDAFGIIRPGCRQVLETVRKCGYGLIVWTAGDETYGPLVQDELFADMDPPDIMLTKKDCVEVEVGDEKVHRKPLSKLADLLKVPVESFLLIDDNPASGEDFPKQMLRIVRFQPPVNPNGDDEEEDLEESDDNEQSVAVGGGKVPNTKHHLRTLLAADDRKIHDTSRKTVRQQQMECAHHPSLLKKCHNANHELITRWFLKPDPTLTTLATILETSVGKTAQEIIDEAIKKKVALPMPTLGGKMGRGVKRQQVIHALPGDDDDDDDDDNPPPSKKKPSDASANEPAKSANKPVTSPQQPLIEPSPSPTLLPPVPAPPATPTVPARNPAASTTIAAPTTAPTFASFASFRATTTGRGSRRR